MPTGMPMTALTSMDRKASFAVVGNLGISTSNTGLLYL